MTNADRVIAALRQHGPLSDSDLVRITGIRPHQQVNQLCWRLEAHGELRRVKNANGNYHQCLGGWRQFSQPSVGP
jgi:hypothetical protein